jgi:hypothetical protein
MKNGKELRRRNTRAVESMNPASAVAPEFPGKLVTVRVKFDNPASRFFGMALGALKLRYVTKIHRVLE